MRLMSRRTRVISASEGMASVLAHSSASTTAIDIDAARGTEDLIQQDGGKVVAMVANVGYLSGLREVAYAVTPTELAVTDTALD